MGEKMEKAFLSEKALADARRYLRDVVLEIEGCALGMWVERWQRCPVRGGFVLKGAWTWRCWSYLSVLDRGWALQTCFLLRCLKERQYRRPGFWEAAALILAQRWCRQEETECQDLGVEMRCARVQFAVGQFTINCVKGFSFWTAFTFTSVAFKKGILAGETGSVLKRNGFPKVCPLELGLSSVEAGIPAQVKTLWLTRRPVLIRFSTFTCATKDCFRFSVLTSTYLLFSLTD